MSFFDKKSTTYGFRILETMFGAFLAIALFFGAKDLESTYMPVVKDFSVSTVKEINGGIEMTGTMNKVRECQFREMMVYVKIDEREYPIAADFEFLDPAKHLTTRAAISQGWGPWRIFIPVPYDSVDIDMFVRHKCHSFYDTSRKLHDFSIERRDGTLVLLNNEAQSS